MKTVKTIQHTIESPLTSPLELVVTIPEDVTEKKIPITVTLGVQPSQNQLANLCCYHYCIPSRNKDEISGTNLISTSNDWILDVTRKTATALCKKSGRPCYVAWTAPQNLEYSSIDQIYVLKNCLNFIKDQL